MGKNLLVPLVLFFSLTVTVINVTAAETSASDYQEWSQTPMELKLKQKVTRLHFYFHDRIGGPNPTALIVAQAPTSNQSSTFFGRVLVADDPLTEGPEPTSKLVGRAQGLYGSAGQKEWSLIMALSLVFTQGKYNGSSLSVLTRNPTSNVVREFAIVGGTGYFRFARGYIVAKTYSMDISLGNAIVEYNVTLVHY